MGWPMGWLVGNLSVRWMACRPVQPHGWPGESFLGESSVLAALWWSIRISEPTSSW